MTTIIFYGNVEFINVIREANHDLMEETFSYALLIAKRIYSNSYILFFGKKNIINYSRNV